MSKYPWVPATSHLVDSSPTTASTAAAANADEGDNDGTKDQYDTTRNTGGEIMRAGGRRKISFLSFIKFIGTDYRIGKPLRHRQRGGGRPRHHQLQLPPPLTRRTTTGAAANAVCFLIFIKFIDTDYVPNRIGKLSATTNKEEDDHDTGCSCHRH